MRVSLTGLKRLQPVPALPLSEETIIMGDRKDKNKASRIEEYPDSMSTACLFYNQKKGHKMAFLVNNIYCGAAVASRLVKWIHLD